MRYYKKMMAVSAAIVTGSVLPAFGLNQGEGGGLLPLSQLKECGTGIRITAICGEVGGGINLDFRDQEGMDVQVIVRATDMEARSHHHGLTEIPEDMTDAGISIALRGNHGWERNLMRILFIRPDIRFYMGDHFKRALASWEARDPASSHLFTLDVVRAGDRVEIWLDGNYFSFFPFREWAELSITEIRVGERISVSARTYGRSPRFLPVDLVSHPHGGEIKVVDISPGSGPLELEGVPFNLVRPDSYMDTGLAKWLNMEEDSQPYYDRYYRRSTWDGIPESLILSVPKRHYNNLYLLAAVDGKRSPELGIRVARYRQSSSGAGATQADVNLRLDPESPLNCRVVPVGEIITESESGRQDRLPLYFVQIPLNTGELADYLQLEGIRPRHYEGTDFLYIEFTRRLETRVTGNLGTFEVKPLGAQSGVLVFGVTLEKAPVDLFVGSGEPGNIFYINQDPELKVEINNPGGAEHLLSMKALFTDYFGVERRLERNISVGPAIKDEVAVPLDGFDPGWYSAEFTFIDSGGTEIWRQPLTLALLPPDTRRATFDDQPHYGTWWFRAHNNHRHADLILPLVKKLGFRFVSPQNIRGYEPARGITNENFESYKVTPSMMSFGVLRRAGDDPADLEKAVREFSEQWPNTKYAMIFHETRGPRVGPGLPPEILGEEPPVFEGQDRELLDQLHEQIKLYATAIRNAAPHMQIILGNGMTSFNLQWLRENLSAEYWDLIGMEQAVQSFSPEGQPNNFNIQSFWIAERMREIYGRDDLRTTSCYELCYRSTGPGGLSLKRQADWYARDLLHMLAYRLPNINVGLLVDTDTAYYTSRWGATGLTFRSPLMMPKPSFVALATLTKVLDLAEYKRYLDIGSHGSYCMEFRRNGEYVYALWATRGEYEMKLVFENKSGEYELVDSMGRRTPGQLDDGIARLTATETPAYLTTETRVASARVLTPIHAAPGFETATIAAPMDNAADWGVLAEGMEILDQWCPCKPVAQGEFSIGQGSGNSIEVRMHPDPGIPAIMGRYATLKMRGEPVVIEGEPDTIGVWVKGNANWGRIIFELTDAAGRVWTSTKAGNWDMSDWQDDTSINFDGWRFVSMPLRAPNYPSGYYPPSALHWRSTASERWAEMAYPLRLDRIHVIMREKLVYLNDLVEAGSMSIEMRDITLGKTRGRGRKASGTWSIN